MGRRLFLAMLVVGLLLSWMMPGCGDSSENSSPGDNTPQGDPPLLKEGHLGIDVILPDDAEAVLVQAGQDLLNAAAAITGVETIPEPTLGDLDVLVTDAAVVVLVDDTFEEAGEQGYALSTTSLETIAQVLQVRAKTSVGAAYGLYRIQMDMGVRYHHPEESFFPDNAQATLPFNYDGTVDLPHFQRRGFHEHTQHPIVYSDFFMRPQDGFDDYLDHYLLWLLRNRQNVSSYIMLKSVDLETWTPYMQSYTEKAHAFGIETGVVIGFVDQQQNAFKMVREDRLDENGVMMAEEDQIKLSLDAILAGGFDFVTFQIGTSEFSMPEPETILGYLDTAVGYLRELYPSVRSYAWIHTTCDLKLDDGSFYYHIPLEADTDLGAWVHTTMFYTLESPAPVYECESFDHHLGFMDQAKDQRELVYFPETAWWLGFDNNAPVVLPITGLARQMDIQESLASYPMTGHITFTSGREWTYWQYDHYLTQVTWDDSIAWNDYLDWISPMFGDKGNETAEALKSWTSLQNQHFFEDYPEIYFYIAGELKQDEIGEQAGILARRPKLSFKKVLMYDEDTFNTWNSTDLGMLKRMLDEYRAALDKLPEESTGSERQQALFHETRMALYVFVKRIEHAIHLYEGVAEARTWYQETLAAADEERDPDESLKNQTLAAAQAKLDAAKAISAEMKTLFGEMESHYRYSVDLLCREKPETPTLYPFGYLEQTSTAFFWTRRDDQLEQLIGTTFNTLADAWTQTPDFLFTTDKEKTSLRQPDHAMASSTIASFMPQFLFGLKDYAPDSGRATLLLAQDHNLNLLPDSGTEESIEGTIDNTTWSAGVDAYTILIHDSAGFEIGTMTLLDAQIRLTLDAAQGTINNLTLGELEGTFNSAELVSLVMSVGGIDEDGTTALIKAIYDVDSDEDLPERLPIFFEFTYDKVEVPQR